MGTGVVRCEPTDIPASVAAARMPTVVILPSRGDQQVRKRAAPMSGCLDASTAAVAMARPTASRYGRCGHAPEQEWRGGDPL